MNTIPESKRWTRKFTAPFRAIKAGLLGNFWLPCPLCGEKFAGFEHGDSIPTDIGRGVGVCAMEGCCTEARRRTRVFYDSPEVTAQMNRYYSRPSHDYQRALLAYYTLQSSTEMYFQSLHAGDMIKARKFLRSRQEAQETIEGTDPKVLKLIPR